MGRNYVELTEKDIAQIEIMAGLGLPYDLMAPIIGVSKATFCKMKDRDPRVEQALQKGVGKARYNVSKALYSLAVDERNLSAIIWWEKTRAGLSDKQEVKVTDESEVNQPQVHVYIPDNERDSETEVETTVKKRVRRMSLKPGRKRK